MTTRSVLSTSVCLSLLSLHYLACICLLSSKQFSSWCTQHLGKHTTPTVTITASITSFNTPTPRPPSRQKIGAQHLFEPEVSAGSWDIDEVRNSQKSHTRLSYLQFIWMSSAVFKHGAVVLWWSFPLIPFLDISSTPLSLSLFLFLFSCFVSQETIAGHYRVGRHKQSTTQVQTQIQGFQSLPQSQSHSQSFSQDKERERERDQGQDQDVPHPSTAPNGQRRFSATQSSKNILLWFNIYHERRVWSICDQNLPFIDRPHTTHVASCLLNAPTLNLSW